MDSAEARQAIQTVGAAPVVASVDTIALYSPADGRIHHLHETFTMEGAERRSPQEQRRSLLETVRRLDLPVEQFEVLHVKDFLSSRGVAYRVDLGTKTLVEVPDTRRPTG